MRQIKFRIWLKNKETMDYNDCFIRASGNPVIWQGDEQEKNSYVLMQFTGLKDKNGVEIYEGDIIKNEGYNEKASVIKWDEKGAYFHIFRGDTSSGYTLQGETRNAEIIGNIWENPELLS